MDPLKKELLIEQFPNIFSDQYKRIEKAKIYYEKLKDLDYFYFPQTNFDNSNIFIDFPIICKNYELKIYIWKKSLTSNIDIKNYYYTNCGSERIYEIYKEKKELTYSDNVAKNIFMLPVNKILTIKILKK